tara:strand:- start:188 stop:430 length:243 start_codon:yes stop_codon:yes gene_type:complete
MGDDDIGIQEINASKSGEKLGFLDRIIGRIISRKFFVFLTATGLMAWHDLTSDTWGMIAMIYIGSQSAIDAALAWKHGSK